MESNVESLKLIGNRFFKEGDYSKSVEYYSQALDLLTIRDSEVASLLATLYSNRAACWLKLDLCDKCINDCTASLLQIPNDKKAYYRRALAYHKINDNRKSLEDVRMLLYLDPNNVDGKKLFDIVRRLVEKDKKTSQVSLIIESIAKETNPIDYSLSQLISICDDNTPNIVEFGRENGHLLIIQHLSSLLSTDMNETGVATAVLYLKLLSTLTKEVRFVELFFKFCFNDKSIASSSSTNYSFVADEKLTLDILKLLFHDEQKISLWTILLTKNIFISISKMKEYYFSDEHYISAIVQILLYSLQKPNTITYGALCEIILTISVGEMKEYNAKNFLQTLQMSKQVCSLLIKHGIFDVLFDHLVSDVGLIRTQAMTLCGKIIKCFDQDDEIKLALSPIIEDKHHDLIAFRRIASIQAALLASNPALGSWSLEVCGGIDHLKVLLTSFDERNMELAAEVICLASGNDSAAPLLTPLVEDGTIRGLTNSNYTGVAAAATSALAKLSIRSKALNEASVENAEILNSAVSVIRQVTAQAISQHTKEISSNSVVMNSLERAIEIIAAMTINTYVKEEVVHGSYRCKECLTTLLKVDIDCGSSLAFGISQILFSLTVTNKELKVQALLDKDISLEQFEKLQELQRIKTTDENGKTIEERKTEDDFDTQELCNSRSRKIVEQGGFELLLRILKDGSNQAKHLSARALRQICVDHTVRGTFTQCGGLKLCANIACDASTEINVRIETGHAVAKALVTTNPHLLTDHMRLGSIRALLFLSRESKCSQLQQFETLLALTNLLSCGNNEQDRFIADNGIQAVHYLIFSDNPMVRRAATEALCNLSGHESLLKILRSEEKLKLWLGLAEDWDNASGDEQSEQFKTARAALATIAMAAADPEVAKTLVNVNCVDTIKIALQSNSIDILKRVIYLLNELICHECGINHLHDKNLLKLLAEKDVRNNIDLKSAIDDILNYFH